MGTVYLVGAGAGDRNLLTLRARRIIEMADVIVYDRLVSRSILAMAPEEAIYINVGKQQGHHPIKQNQINELLIEQAKEYQIVVRLKGGDPYLFGRGGEEAEALYHENIAFEVINGVPSPIAVLNYAGIPVTHRDCASNVQIISAHRREDMEADIDFSSIVQAGGTMIFLMGVSALSTICAGLTCAGMEPVTPAAIIENGTTARMKSVTGCLEDLPRLAEENKIATPALIVVGEVVQYQEQLQWYQKKTLHHARVIVTRAQAQASRLTDMLLDRGAEVMEAAVINIIDQENHMLRTELEHIYLYDYLVFTSENGVEAMIRFLQHNNLDVRMLGNIPIAAIGKGTARALKKYALPVDLMPSVYSGEALGEALAECLTSDAKVLALRAQETSDSLQRVLDEAGIDLVDVPVYQTNERMKNANWVQEWLDEGFVYVMLGSASCARSFANTVGKEKLSCVHAICIGEMTDQEARKQGYIHRTMADEATLENMVQTLERVHQQN